jgi:hypothetical protein
LDFTDVGFSELQELKNKSGEITTASVIRNALAIYKWYLDTKCSDLDIIVRDKNGDMERIRFIP